MGKPNFRLLLFFLTPFLFYHASAQQKFTISGLVKSFKTGETIIGATIRVDSLRVGTTSNEYGFFSLTLVPGSHRVEVSGLGFKVASKQVELTKDLTVDFLLEEATKELQNVVVTAASRGGRSLAGTQMGVERLTIAETNNIPMIMGERDILKTIQLLPGIKSAGDGGSGFFVRGGAADQNLILLDEAPVYNASHLFGFFSTFNSDAIKDVTVYKGGMPAQYAGRQSSVVDVRMNDGNTKDFGASGGIGLIASRLNLEGPLQQGKSSFLLSGRRTYADVFVGNENKLYFYDLNMKMNYEINKKNKIYLSGYFGKDRLQFGDGFGIDWGNATGTLRWNHIFNNKLFSNTSLIFSNYDYEIKIDDKATDVNIFSQIKDWNIKEELQWFPNSSHSVRVGFNAIYHTMRPGEISSAAATNFNTQQLSKRHSLENGLYASDTWKATSGFSITYGARLTAFSILGTGDFYNIDGEGNVTDTLRYKGSQVVKTYINIEPRLALSLMTGRQSSIKASYVRNVQNLHLIANSSASSPTDKWVPSTNIIKPGISDQVSLGFYKNIAGNKYELTVETYYKKLQNQIDYRNGAELFNNNAIESQLLFGEGRAYGVEWLLKKKVGRFTGWLSYTLSKTERKIDGLNNGEWYSARQDRTHDVAIVTSYLLNDRWTLSANWVFYTGDAVTFPSGKYNIGTETYFYYTERNGYRMPNYHRLDLGATRKLGKKKNQHKRFKSELALGLYNAYGRQNAYTISFRESESDPTKTEAVRLALFRFVPSISYNFKF